MSQNNAKVTQPIFSHKIKGTLTIGTRFTVAYNIYGQKKLPTLFLINGVAQSMATWLPLVRELSSHYRIVCFDFPGIGRSEVLSGDLFVSHEESTSIIKELYEHLSINNQISILSASYGTAIACFFAQENNKLVDKLVLASLSIRPNSHLQNIQQTLIQYINTDQYCKIAETILSQSGHYLPSRLQSAIRHQFDTITEKQAVTFKKHMEWLLQCDTPEHMFNFTHIHAKTLIMLGEEDPLINMEDIQTIQKNLQHCTVHICKKAHHFLHLEQDRNDIIQLYKQFLLR